MKPFMLIFLLGLAHHAAETNFVRYDDESLRSDLKRCVELLEKAIAENNSNARTALAKLLTKGAVDRKGFYLKANPARAVELYQRALDDHSHEAFEALASLYAVGIGEPRNDAERPAELWKHLADKGHERAMGEMKHRYLIGFGVEKDLLRAAGYSARSRIQAMQLTRTSGLGQTIDMDVGPEAEIMREISRKFESAWKSKSGPELLALGEMHERGEHGRPNLVRAVALYAAAGKLGVGEAAAKIAAIEPKLDAIGRNLAKDELAWIEQGLIEGELAKSSATNAPPRLAPRFPKPSLPQSAQ